MYSFEELQEKINAEIELRKKELSEYSPAELYQPVAYSISMGGKRLRPVLLLMAYNLFSNKVTNALPAAVAIEIFHNFTLLHDDIMDKAPVRRNQPTVHVKFSENNAILSGDVMAFLAYRYLLECKSDRIFEVAALFTETAVEVCEGQQFDMDFENRLDVTAEEYLRMIQLKTAVLLGGALKSGALLANAADDVASQLYHFGLNLGMAFQLQDDLLDTFGNPEKFGKQIGGDILSNKKTFLLIKALENASDAERRELLFWLDKKNFNEKEKIEQVTGLYNRLNTREITLEKIDFYFQHSAKILDEIPVAKHEKKQLQVLSNKMLNRDH